MSKCAENPEKCVSTQNAPRLSEICAIYTRKVAKRWVLMLTADLARFCGGNAVNVNVEAVQDLAELIIDNAYFLNAGEILLFFHRFKSGRYGKFYKTFEPLTVMQGLSEFKKERIEIIKRVEAKNRKEEQARLLERNGISYKQYVELRKKAADGDSDAMQVIGLSEEDVNKCSFPTENSPLHNFCVSNGIPLG